MIRQLILLCATTIPVIFTAFIQRDIQLTVPYFSGLVSPLNAGQTLYVRGKVREDAHRFSINLLKGGYQTHLSSAVILHVNPRFDKGTIILNTFQNGKWGKEEHVKNPLKRGAEFDIKIRFHVEKYEIIVNQVKITEFKPRLPLHDAEFLSIEGQVTLNSVHRGEKFYTLPFDLAFYKQHLAIGDRMYIYGIPTGSSFSINFLSITRDILFHYNPRMDENLVFRNSWINGIWGKEEIEGEFPFKKNLGFDLEIRNEPNHIHIFHNGKSLGTFAHRTQDPARDYVAFRIDGDLELVDVQFVFGN